MSNVTTTISDAVACPMTVALDTHILTYQTRAYKAADVTIAGGSLRGTWATPWPGHVKHVLREVLPVCTVVANADPPTAFTLVAQPNAHGVTGLSMRALE